MSCEKCEEMQESSNVYYIRVDKANVGILACEEHFMKVREKLLK